MREKQYPHQIPVRVTADLYDDLVADAKANDRTVAATARRALRQYIDKAKETW